MKLLDVVATAENVPSANLSKGQVGTIVDVLCEEEGIFLVEFADLTGVTYALEPLSQTQLMELHHSSAIATQ